MISLNKLLSTCIDSCSRGCQVIRYVDNKRKQQSQQNHHPQQQQSSQDQQSDNTNFNVTYKVANDPRSALTEADLASQRVILYCIRSVWGKELNIIGEEDSDDPDDSEDSNNTITDSANDDDDSDESVFQKYNINLPDEEPIRKDLGYQNHYKQNGNDTTKNNNPIDTSGSNDIMVAISDLTLYIDPMDGTREFVEDRLDNVQCLIGIAYKGKPIGGVIGLPFLWNDNSNHTDIINGKDVDKKSEKKENDKVYIVSGLHWENNNVALPSTSFVKTICMEKGKSIDGLTLQNHEELFLSLGSSTGSSGANMMEGLSTTATSTVSPTASSNDNIILNVYTGDSNRIHKKNALKYLSSWMSDNNTDPKSVNGTTSNPTLNIHIAGGCGNKILRTIATGLHSGTKDGNAIVIIPPGTCSWDTAAPTAILFATLALHGIKGKVTDMFGGELVYDSNGKKVTNDLGALVSIGSLAVCYHEKLCSTFRGDDAILNSLLNKYWIHSGSSSISHSSLVDDGNHENIRIKLQIAQQEPQAIDFVRNENGHCMTCHEVKMIVTETIKSCYHDLTLIGYSIPEKEAIRNSKSDSDDKRVDKCVLYLFWSDGETSSVLYEKVYGIDNNDYKVKWTRQ